MKSNQIFNIIYQTKMLTTSDYRIIRYTSQYRVGTLHAFH